MDWNFVRDWDLISFLMGGATGISFFCLTLFIFRYPIERSYSMIKFRFERSRFDEPKKRK